MEKETRKATAGAIISELRVTKKVTQQKLAEKIGANSPQAVQNLMKPGRSMTTDNLIKLADALGCDVIIRDRVNDEEFLVISNMGESK